MRLWLVRHGQTEANTRQLFCGKSESPLTPTGIGQACVVANLLRNVPFDHVLMSERERARHTAQLILQPHHPQPRTSALLNEMDFGAWEMQHHSTLIEQDKQYQAWCADWQHVTPPEGESFARFTERVAKLAGAARSLQADNLLLVSHQGVISQLLAQLLNMPPAAMWHFAIEQGAWSRIDLKGDYATLRYLNNHGNSTHND
ncbi:adenosylcobalamin/alpha-ribazole phosphatase [Mangrovibacter plantisponsor]|uniref:Alpha-ribazole phosphatase n=1 Tax=Mangrovibacter plantisponsor TaxID=451513 RepID=A0A317PZ78_9ENTR|nr:adenosylcobalamin/alpha-ribazole phosphatase [Mangrovibacter plantisponsor]PWW08022.1 adenosylcobalamin phosphatase [Mangrovibacter plantisponsor]